MAESAWDQNNKGAKKPVPPTVPAKPDPSMLGTGGAAKAGEAIKKRKSKIDQALEDAGA